MKFFATAILLIFIFHSINNSQNPPADLIVVNAVVRTMDDKFPRAQSVAVSGNKIIAVGTDSDIKKLAAKNTKIIDAAGKLVIPGFNDAHVHFLGIGNLFSSLDVRDAMNTRQIAEKIRYFVRFVPKNRWILGNGWNHLRWKPAQMPNKILIDEAAPDHPVFLYSSDAKTALVNSAALKIAGITIDKQADKNGAVIRDENGEPTGILTGDAMRRVRGLVPAFLTQDKPAVAETASNYAAAFGVTSVQDMSADDNTEIYRELLRQGKLKTRIYECIGLTDWKKTGGAKFNRTEGDAMIRRGCLKHFTEGDAELIPDLTEKIAAADRAGWQVMIHAIGGASNAVILSVFENVIKENGGRDRRFRVEHAHNIRIEDIKRFGASKIIASMQPALFFGGVLNNSEPYRSLLETNAPVAFGSDSSMIPINPFEGIYAAVMKENSIGAEKTQSLSVEEAVKLYTIGAAFAEFQENEKGTISVGKLADFLILSENIFTIDPNNIGRSKVLTTVMNGKIVYESN